MGLDAPTGRTRGGASGISKNSVGSYDEGPPEMAAEMIKGMTRAPDNRADEKVPLG